VSLSEDEVREAGRVGQERIDDHDELARGERRHGRPGSGSIATGLPAVIQTARTGGSSMRWISGPNSGSQIVRGAAPCRR